MPEDSAAQESGVRAEQEQKTAVSNKEKDNAEKKQLEKKSYWKDTTKNLWMASKHPFAEFKRKLIPITVDNVIDVHRLKLGSNVHADPLYRLIQCHLPNEMKKKFTCYTEDFSQGYDKQRISMFHVTDKYFRKNLYDYKVHEDEIRTFNLAIEKDPFDAKKQDKLLQENPNEWQKIVNYLVDDSGNKDPAITAFATTCLYDIPIQKAREWQQYNNHAIIVTIPQTAKSFTMESVGGMPVKSWTEASLLGGYFKGKKNRPVTEGEGVLSFSEFTAKDDDESLIRPMELTLDMMESGYNIRAVGDSLIESNGCKKEAFLGNCRDNEFCDEYGWYKTLGLILRPDSLAKGGRRVAHPWYGDHFLIMKKGLPFSKEIKTKCSISVKGFFKRHRRTITSFVEKMIQRHIEGDNASDKDYAEKILHRTKNMMSLSKFYESHIEAVPQIKFAAIAYVTAVFADKIAFQKLTKKSADKLYHEMYAKFKQWNIDTIDNFMEAATKYDAFLKYCILKPDTLKREMTPEERDEACNAIAITKTTLYRYRSKALSHGVKRTQLVYKRSLY